MRVAYNLRFLPVFREIERILREAVIGQTLFVRIEAGQHLGAWRPARPYALGYSASTARGGGVALDLSHELDYMRMLFGHPIACCGAPRVFRKPRHRESGHVRRDLRAARGARVLCAP